VTRIVEQESGRDGRAGRLFSRAEMRRTGRVTNGYPWPVRVPGGPQVCCTNYVGLISARSNKIEKHNFSFLLICIYYDTSSIDAVTAML
jgi:hypothetical protein